LEIDFMDKVLLSHGSGRGLQQLLETVVLPSLIGESGEALEDAAIVQWNTSSPVVFTTDSFVVTPLSFPGGDIGKLAACGTINDLAMMGAVPHSMAVALIIEEGLPIDALRTYLTSLRSICKQQGVSIVCGDTKVTERGKGDGIYITTTGIGTLSNGDPRLSARNARDGDVVIVSGPIGLHGVTILAQRENLAFVSSAVSDCAPLVTQSRAVLDASSTVRVMRDATRGGCAAVLNEIASSSNVSIVLEQASLPIPEVVRCACSFLGLDPLQIANEGTFVAVVAATDCDAVLRALHALPEGKGACRIGRVAAKQRTTVSIITEIGGVRAVEVPPGQLLPRIC
jgi:hydrogenase expression/formation protein HypE